MSGCGWGEWRLSLILGSIFVGIYIKSSILHLEWEISMYLINWNRIVVPRMVPMWLISGLVGVAGTLDFGRGTRSVEQFALHKGGGWPAHPRAWIGNSKSHLGSMQNLRLGNPRLSCLERPAEENRPNGISRGLVVVTMGWLVMQKEQGSMVDWLGARLVVGHT